MTAPDIHPSVQAAGRENGADLAALLPAVEAIARTAGARLLDRWSEHNRLTDRASLVAGLQANEDAVAAWLRTQLTALHPATWLPEELETAELPAGDFWVVDAVEGNINLLHGLPEWGVTIALVRDGRTVLAVVFQPVPELLFSARAGRGAAVNGAPLTVSAVPSLETAIAATGQAEAGQTSTYVSIGASITAMLGAALLVRAAVPSTFPLLRVASGQNDVFWQFRPTLPGVAAGALIAAEAGATVSRIDGSAWIPGAADILVSAPQLHAAAAAVLSKVA
jgi:myo-inositol-1(or 4)-monophosphatase